MNTPLVAAFFLSVLCEPSVCEAVEVPPPPPRRIHLFVALCDNESQGIAPVGKKIGNGDDPEANLYWGCGDGAGAYFSHSKLWTTLEKASDVSETILRRAIFRHKETGTILVADAYRGKEIRACLTDFLAACEGNFEPDIDVREVGTLSFGTKAGLVAFIGHNGLMEFDVPGGDLDISKPKPDSIVLSCLSEGYFDGRLRRAGSRPFLLTSQLMYPGAFLFHDAIEGWLKNETPAQIRDRAALAYVKNQKISIKAARGVFAELPAEGWKPGND